MKLVFLSNYEKIKRNIIAIRHLLIEFPLIYIGIKLGNSVPIYSPLTLYMFCEKKKTFIFIYWTKK